MSLETSFDLLVGHDRRLRDALHALCLTVREDLPRGGEAALADNFGDTTEDLLGWLEEGLAAGESGQRAAGGRPPDWDGARRALIICQDRHNHLARRFAFELTNYDRLRLLTQLARERGGEWRPWAGSVRHALDACRAPLDEINQALFVCWQELAERARTLPQLCVPEPGVGPDMRPGL